MRKITSAAFHAAVRLGLVWSLAFPIRPAMGSGCDLLSLFETRDAELTQLLEKIPSASRGPLGKKLAALLADDQKRLLALMGEVGTTKEEGQVVSELTQLGTNSRKNYLAIEAFAPVDRSLAAINTRIFKHAPGAKALLEAEAKRLDSLYEDMSVKGHYNARELDRIEIRLKSLEYLGKLDRPIRYVNPGHHDATKAGMTGAAGGKRGAGAGTSELPANHEELWSRAIPDASPEPLAGAKPGTKQARAPRPDKNWWVYDGKNWHRFMGDFDQVTGEYQFHWSGSDRSSDRGDLALNPQDIPIEVRRYFGQN